MAGKYKVVKRGKKEPYYGHYKQNNVHHNLLKKLCVQNRRFWIVYQTLQNNVETLDNQLYSFDPKREKEIKLLTHQLENIEIEMKKVNDMIEELLSSKTFGD